MSATLYDVTIAAHYDRCFCLPTTGRLAPAEKDFRPFERHDCAPYSELMKKNRDLTVLIVDEHSDISPLLAWRLRMVRGIRVIGETANVMLGAELAHQLEPDVILADFRRTGPPRSETYRWLSRVSPKSRVNRPHELSTERR